MVIKLLITYRCIGTGQISLKAAQGDSISLGIASCQQEFRQGEVLGRYAIAAYDALRNRCDRLFNTPALFRNMSIMQREVIFLSVIPA